MNHAENNRRIFGIETIPTLFYEANMYIHAISRGYGNYNSSRVKIQNIGTVG